ncbi:uncharacterized protein TNCV_3512851 [Trichonephila clavipes]|nr:uncharacterized protein TNCV_3512851 [Trichonephila clavipes]
MYLRNSESPVRVKFNQTLSVRKMTFSVFWDRKGNLLIDFLPSGETVNAAHFRETEQKLRRVIQNKSRGMITTNDMLLHNDARPHTAVLMGFGWELFDHPPFSPDLVPSHFNVFLLLKKFLSSGERFGNDKVLKTSVSIHRWHSSKTERHNVDPTILQVSQFWWRLCCKIAEALMYLMPINMFLKV